MTDGIERRSELTHLGEERSMAVSTASPVSEVRALLDRSDMSRAQIGIVGLTILLAGMDGYDVQAMSFAAPVVSSLWGLSKAMVGLVLASSLFGMAFGALVLAPLADRHGRRSMVLVALAIMTGGSAFSAMSQNVEQLFASRLLTGIGIGLMVTLTTAIASEFANSRRRGLAVAATSVGFAGGGVLGGAIASLMLKVGAWQWVFGFGALSGAVLIAAVLLGMPESPDFLISRRPADALARVNRLLTRFGHPLLAELPIVNQVQERNLYRALFAPGLAGITIRLSLIYVLMVTAAYFQLSWLPQVVTDAGHSAATASLIVTSSNGVSIIGGLFIGSLAGRFRVSRLSGISMLGFGAALAALGSVPPTVGLLVLTSGLSYVLLSGATGTFYATTAGSFSAMVRVSGVGMVMAIGRVFSAFGPFLGGLLFDAGLGRQQVSIIFGGLAFLAGVLMLRSGTKLLGSGIPR